MSDMELFGLLSWLFSLLLLMCWRRYDWKGYLGAFLSCALTGILLGIYFLADSFTGQGVTAAVLFHAPLIFNGHMLKVFSFHSFSVFFAIVLMVVAFFDARKRCGKYRPPFPFVVVTFLTMLMSQVFNPVYSDGYKIVKPYFDKRGLDDFLLKQSRISEIKKNEKSKQFSKFIYIYLEGVDQSFFDIGLYPELLPNLSNVKNLSLTVDGIVELPSLAWTLSGIVGSQCGFPAPLVAGREIGRGESVMCVGDLLKNAGYRLHYIGGADLAFASKGAFLQAHGFDRVVGKNELLATADNELYAPDWGVFDDDLFSHAWLELEQLNAVSEKFGLFLLTLDTHSPKGRKTPACKSLAYAKNERSLLNAIHCTDYLVSSFVYKVLNDPRFSDIVIVIASDHLMPVPSISNEASSKRVNTWFVLNSGEVKKIDVTATAMDIAPSLLELIGFDVPALGFGRSFFRDGGNTLLAEYGQKDLERLLQAWLNSE